MPDAPDPPLTKLNHRRTLAELDGKEFDEALERRVLKLPPSDYAVHIPAAADRERLIAREDAEGQRSDEQRLVEARRRMEEESRAEQVAQSDVQLAIAQRRIAELEKQLSEATHATFPAPAPPVEVPAPREKRPEPEWSRDAIMQWAEQHDIEVPRNWRQLSALTLLDMVLAAVDAAPSAEMEEAASLQEGELTLA